MKKIMLVDDVEISNFIMRKMIEKVSADYEIYDYIYPSKAIADLNQINPDIIFLDLNMPGMDGWQFLEFMKENNVSLPVYILTSSTSELDLQKSQNYNNVRDFLIKPLNANKLKTILNNVLNFTVS